MYIIQSLIQIENQTSKYQRMNKVKEIVQYTFECAKFITENQFWPQKNGSNVDFSGNFILFWVKNVAFLKHHFFFNIYQN